MYIPYIIIILLIGVYCFWAYNRDYEILHEREEAQKREKERQHQEFLNEIAEKEKKEHEKICHLSNSLNISYDSAKEFYFFLVNNKKVELFIDDETGEKQIEIYREFLQNKKEY